MNIGGLKGLPAGKRDRQEIIFIQETTLRTLGVLHILYRDGPFEILHFLFGGGDEKDFFGGDFLFLFEDQALVGQVKHTAQAVFRSGVFQRAETASTGSSPGKSEKEACPICSRVQATSSACLSRRWADSWVNA